MSNMTANMAAKLLADMAREFIGKYKDAEIAVIEEYSGTPDQDEVELERECELALKRVGFLSGELTCEKLPALIEQECIVKRSGLEMHFGYWRCGKCQCENFEGARFCMNCGAEAVEL